MKTKTLRQHLLDRDHAAMPRLDVMREALVARLAEANSISAQPETGSAVLDLLRTLWREWIVPYRGGWSTLAAVWVLILGAARWSEAGEGRARLTEAEFATLSAGLRESRDLAMGAGGVRENTSATVAPPLLAPSVNSGRDSSWIGGGRVATEGRC